MCEEMFANACAAINHNVRQQHSIVANLDVLVNQDVYKRQSKR